MNISHKNVIQVFIGTVLCIILYIIIILIKMTLLSTQFPKMIIIQLRIRMQPQKDSTQPVLSSL